MGTSNIWFTADLHFGHRGKPDGVIGGIIKHASRPFKTIEEHDEYLIKRWNETVDKHGIVYIIGDFAWRNPNHYVQALNGKKILITGSHDKMSQLNLHQFTSVYQGMLITTFNKIPFVLTHCSMRVWERSYYGAINLYGHSHGRLEEFPDRCQMDVGVDVADDYAPFSLEFILYKMSLKIKRDYQHSEPDKFVKINKENNLKLMEG